MHPSLIPLDAAPVPSGGKRRITPKNAKTHAYRARCPTCKGAQPATPDDKCKDCITIWDLYGRTIANVMTRMLRRTITPWVIAGPRSFLGKALVEHGKVGGKKLVGAEFDVWLAASIEAWLLWRRGIVDIRELPERLKSAWRNGETGLGWVGWLDGGGARS